MSMEISKRMSGRYPWGEGVEAFPNALAFLERIQELASSATRERAVIDEINSLLPDELKMNVPDFRMFRMISYYKKRDYDVDVMCQMHQTGMAFDEIASALKTNESVVRSTIMTQAAYRACRKRAHHLFDSLTQQVEMLGSVIVYLSDCRRNFLAGTMTNETVCLLRAEYGFTCINVKIDYDTLAIIVTKDEPDRMLTHLSKIHPFVWPKDLDRAVES